ncbi:hypothetical protein [Candidatus Spongiihabitans sp.]|uniref:hypothetical protein n=1 Tax=Candidatus Spongiihabitans sp. TaxID=3101308 RepID=UPI003C6FE8E5
MNDSVEIFISTRTYARLEKHVKGFESPDNVVERLLDHYEGVDATRRSGRDFESGPQSRPTRRYDYTKYIFNDTRYGKSRLVLAVVKKYVEENPGISFSKLLEIFPCRLQGSLGVFVKLPCAQEIYERTSHKRHFIEHDETIKLPDSVIAVCSQWGRSNIIGFLKLAEEIGHTITPV